MTATAAKNYNPCTFCPPRAFLPLHLRTVKYVGYGRTGFYLSFQNVAEADCSSEIFEGTVS